MEYVEYLTLRSSDDFVESCSTFIRKTAEEAEEAEEPFQEEPPQKDGHYTLMRDKFTVGGVFKNKSELRSMVGGSLVGNTQNAEGIVDKVLTPKPKNKWQKRRESFKLARDDLLALDTQGINANSALPPGQRVKWKFCVFLNDFNEINKDPNCVAGLIAAYPSV